MAEIDEEVVIAMGDDGEMAVIASIEKKSGQQVASKGFGGGESRRVGIAFQGGVFPAGAMAAGAVKYLIEAGAFDDKRYENRSIL